MEKYTKLSQEVFNKLLQNSLAPSEAVAFFVDDVPTRTFKDALLAVYSGADLKSRLVEGLFAMKTAFYEVFLSVDSKVRLPARDSVRRNVSNWVDGKTVPQKRMDVFGLCYALGLGINEADTFLRQSSGYGFHMREPLEIALFYCLHTKKTIDESAAFIKGLDLSVPETGSDAGTKTTDIVEGEFWSKVCDDKSLIGFLNENRSSFGRMHNTAFKYFNYYYSALSAPEKAEDTSMKSGKDSFEDRFSVGRVVAERLRFRLPLADNLDGHTEYTEYQKTIRESWLGETSVKRILERKEDVSRKALLLLYISTSGSGKSTNLTRMTVDGNTYDSIETMGIDGIDDFGGAFDEWEAYEDLTPQQSLEEHTTHLDLILTDCGFSRLDPRTPFDWLVLYSLCVNEADYYDEEQKHEFGLMSERLEKVLKLLFPEIAGNDLHDDLS